MLLVLTLAIYQLGLLVLHFLLRETADSAHNLRAVAPVVGIHSLSPPWASSCETSVFLEAEPGFVWLSLRSDISGQVQSQVLVHSQGIGVGSWEQKPERPEGITLDVIIELTSLVPK